jgi:hypothetical protein
MGWGGGYVRKAYKILVVKPEGKKYLQDLDEDGK